MIRESDLHFHLRRARAELDLARRGACPGAVESHLRLSELHMQRFNALGRDVVWRRDSLAQAAETPRPVQETRFSNVGEVEAVST